LTNYPIGPKKPYAEIQCASEAHLALSCMGCSDAVEPWSDLALENANAKEETKCQAAQGKKRWRGKKMQW
jgi:hypothetical protein